MNKFKEIDCRSLDINVFNSIGRNWMLITSGTESRYNTMTASWGGLGILWNKPVVFSFVRPQRYTYEFMEKNDYFSICFFDEKWKNTLNFCGTNSGRDCDKAKETGLTPIFDSNTTFFEQAKLVFVCKKLYSQELSENCVVENDIKSNYSNNDYHKMYVGEIIKTLEPLS